ncbi:MAG: NUDIX domain-containing protein [Candidatus Ozemobacteraceae bacterium]
MMYIPEDDYSRIQAFLPILCVDCLIIHAGKCLLLRRTREPAKGQYWFPGGRVFKGELIKDAALRKARDEVNLECKYERTISIEETFFQRQGDMLFDIHTVNVCCHLSVTDIGMLIFDETHDGYIWASLEHARMANLHEAVFLPLLKCLE